jgi:hypothetical protein
MFALALALAPVAFAADPAPAPPPAPAKTVTVAVQSLTANGLEVRDLDCALAKGGLLAPLLVVGTLAEQKPALDACAPQGAATTLSWRWEVGATRDVSVTATSAPATSPCVIGAMSGLAPAQDALVGTCTATVLIGATGAASAAADGLKAPGTP